MLNDFKKFILRGNVIDLAVAVLIGAAFSSVISSLVRDMITPLITAIRGKGTDFSHLYFTLHGSKFMYGDFINSVVSFVVISVVIFFLVIQPINKLLTYSNRNRDELQVKEKECPRCLSKIPKKAKRCAFCTSVLN
jgi:large conductance mechanosensitive channel